MDEVFEENGSPPSLGKRIQALREGVKMTGADLARAIGVSRSLIHQIERDTANPSIETLRRIASALQVPIAELFQDGSTPQGIVVRKDERKTLRVPKSRLVYQLLTPNLNRRVEFLWIEIEPGEKSPRTPFSHEGEEDALLIQGELHVWVNGQEHVLREGDAISFDSSLPHALANLGTEKAILVTAITPPSF